MKKDYFTPELEVVYFGSEDVITASTFAPTIDRDEPIELPFVPAH